MSGFEWDILYGLQRFLEETSSDKTEYGQFGSNLRRQAHKIAELESLILTVEKNTDTSRISGDIQEIRGAISEYRQVKGSYFFVKGRRDPIIDKILLHLGPIVATWQKEYERRQQQTYQESQRPVEKPEIDLEKRVGKGIETVPQKPRRMERPTEKLTAYPLIPEQGYLSNLLKIGDLLGRKGRTLGDVAPNIITLGADIAEKDNPNDYGSQLVELGNKILSDHILRTLTLQKLREADSKSAGDIDSLLDSTMNYFENEVRRIMESSGD